MTDVNSPCMSQSLKDSGEKKLLKLGPFGSENAGNSFDDGTHSTIRQLVISYSSDVSCIQVEYDDNGSSFWSEKHGQHDDTYIDTIKLDYPYEYLISVHGKYVKFWRFPTYICSLTFRSNKRIYGPYGEENSLGKNFSIQAPGKMIVGFHGRDSMFMNLRALGAYLKPVEHNLNEKYNPSKVLDVVPASRNRSRPLCQARYPSQTKLRNKHDEDVDDDNKQLSCIIAGNQVKGNEGDQNGAFAVGNTYFNTHYYYP